MPNRNGEIVAVVYPEVKTNQASGWLFCRTVSEPGGEVSAGLLLGGQGSEMAQSDPLLLYAVPKALWPVTEWSRRS